MINNYVESAKLEPIYYPVKLNLYFYLKLSKIEFWPQKCSPTPPILIYLFFTIGHSRISLFDDRWHFDMINLEYSHHKIFFLIILIKNNHITSFINLGRFRYLFLFHWKLFTCEWLELLFWWNIPLFSNFGKHLFSVPVIILSDYFSKFSIFVTVIP